MKRLEQLGQVRPYHAGMESRPPRTVLAKVQRAGIALVLVGALGWLGSCTDEPAGPGSGAATVTVTPQSATLFVQQAVQLAAAVRDANGTIVARRLIVWTSADPAVATVDSSGLATGISPGSAVVIATSSGASDTAAITVVEASVTVTPPSATLLVQQAVQLIATVRDASGTVVADRPIEWKSASPAVATVDSNGLATGIGPGSAALIASSAGASDTATVTVVAPDSLIVSDPFPVAALAEGNAGVVALAGSTGDGVVYVSLAPGTVPTGSRAIIRRAGDATTLTTAVLDGGFDPLSVGAQVGDLIVVIVEDAGGATVYEQRVAVRASRPPVVVRTDPPRDKTDVPVNASIIVVFSEPMDGASLTPTSVRLLAGQTAVSGTVRFLDPTLDPSHVSAEFVPDAPLASEATYQLVVTQQVRDLDGEALATSATVTFTTGASTTGAPASVDHSVSPDSTGLAAGATRQLRATVRDADGNVLTNHPVAWSSSRPEIVSVSSTGLLTGLQGGRAIITASVNALVSAQLIVNVLTGPAAVVVVEPSTAAVPVGDMITLRAMVWDSAGYVKPTYDVSWASSAPTIATVATVQPQPQEGYGLVLGVSEGTVIVTATSGPASGTASVTVGPARTVATVTVNPRVLSLVIGDAATFVATLLDATGTPLSRPVTWESSDSSVAIVDGNWGVVTTVGVGAADIIATSEGVSDTVRVTVITVSFNAVSGGGGYSCGVTVEAAAYCWGYGPLGNGGYAPYRSQVPVAVAGGHTWALLSTGWAHACGVTSAGDAFCWGTNEQGRLGDGSIEWRGSPVAVIGGAAFTTVTAGEGHTCALDAGGTARCWGGNLVGQLGDGTTTDRSGPVAVTGGLTFTMLSAGWRHTCSVTTSGATYCWGWNNNGQLGDGTTTDAMRPVAVQGGLAFTAISSSETHTCGVTPAGTAYCWGGNEYGQLGNGTTTNSTTPVPVAGAATFLAVSAGRFHTCGLTAAGTASCWGLNHYGQLGIGTATGPDGCIVGAPPSPIACSKVPVNVVGGLTFTSLSAGTELTVAMSTAGVAYYWGAVTYPSGSWEWEPLKVPGQP